MTLNGDTDGGEENRSFNSLDTRLSLTNNSLIIELTNTLTPATLYTFTIPKGAITFDDSEGNDEYSFSFTTANLGADINESIFPLSTDTWYERKDTDNGSFDQTIDIVFPLDGVYTNPSLSGVFGTPLMDSIGDSTTPITIDGLPAGLSLNLTKTSTGIRLNLTGNATAHAKDVDNTSFDITFLSEFFQTSDIYTSADVSFSFDIVFGEYWSPRVNHQAFVYKDKIWVLGGYDGSYYKNDIWTSADEGTTWYQVSVTGTHWSGRSEHQAFVYNDKIWVLGGRTGDIADDTNDIWVSADGGINWTQVSVTGTHWSERSEHQAFVYNDKMWVLGGLEVIALPYTMINHKNDIWTSADEGATWDQVSVTETYWSGRPQHQAFVYNDKIWILGGGYGLAYENDIWTSEGSGTNWTPISITPPHWSARYGHEAFVYNNKIWILGGYDGGYKNDIWTSADGGANWTPVSVTAPHWSARYNHGAFVYKDKIWILGGYDGGYKNDIWTSADGGVTWQQVIPYIDRRRY